MLWRWQFSNGSTTSIGSPASCRGPRFGASLVILVRWLSPCAVAEKNDLRRLRADAPRLLRQTATKGPRTLLWRQTGLPCLGPAPGPVLTVRGREKRTLGLARRQPSLHQTLCLLRGPALSPNPDQGGGRGTLPRLARRQGVGQAIHAGATPPDRQTGAEGDRHRRDRRRQGTPIPHRGQRLGAGPSDLVRRQGSLRSQPGRVLCLAWPGKMRQNTLGRHGHVAAVSQLCPQEGPCAEGHDPVRQSFTS